MTKTNSLTIAYVLFGITFGTQCVLSLSIDNILGSLFAVCSSLITLTYLFGRQQPFIHYPISSLALLGLNISTQSGAFFYQTFTFTALEWNLYSPINTFLYVGLFQLTLVFAHAIYRKAKLFTRFRKFLTHRIFVPIGIYKPLPIRWLWAMGGVGLLSLWFSASSGVEYGDAGGKFLVAFIPFCYTPFLIPFYGKGSLSKGLLDTNNRHLIIYTFFLIIVGILKNSRGTFAVGFITFILIYFIFVSIKKILITQKQIKTLAKWVIPLIMLLSLLSDLAVSMTVVRQTRTEISGLELGMDTLSTLFDRETINYYKENQLYRKSDYNEDYISNPIFARLITTKFDDNMLAHSKLLNSTDSLDVMQITGKKVIAQLPTPLINLLGLGVNKAELQFTMEDYVWYLVSGRGLGGYKVGSLTGHGLIMFGGFFYLLCILLFPFLFSILDAFSYRKKQLYLFSPIAFIFIYKFYAIFYSGSFVKMLAFFVRGLPQAIFLYLILIFILNICMPITKKNR